MYGKTVEVAGQVDGVKLIGRCNAGAVTTVSCYIVGLAIAAVDALALRIAEPRNRVPIGTDNAVTSSIVRCRLLTRTPV